MQLLSLNQKYEPPLSSVLVALDISVKNFPNVS